MQIYFNIPSGPSYTTPFLLGTHGISLLEVRGQEPEYWVANQWQF